MKNILITLALLVSFSSIGQTAGIDKLKAIWIDEMIEFGDISIKNIDWTATFVPYYTIRVNPYNGLAIPYKKFESNLSMILGKLDLQMGDYYTKKTAKDANNREMTLSTNRIARGRYWIDFEGAGYASYINLTITDSKNNFVTVGTIRFDKKVEAYKNYDKTYSKYIKKRKIDKRRAKGGEQVLFEEILKRYNN